MNKETMKLALEALEDIKDDCSGCEFEWLNDYPLQAKAKLALEEALAKQEQGEPVAWMHQQGNHEEPSFRELDDWEISNGWKQYPLYTTPQPAQKPLTDEAIATVYWGATGQSLRPQDNVLAHKFAKAIEAVHGIKEKNT